MTEALAERKEALPILAADVAEFRDRMEFEKQRLALMKEFVQGQMIKGSHYGVIPGTGGKPTLLKPGAELLTNIHGLHPEFEETERVCDRGQVKKWERNGRQGETRGLVKYSYRCSLFKAGLKVGEGVGTCNNWEKKYLSVDADDAENTVMKMAKKRAFIDAVLTATRTSDFFTQDLEDMDESAAEAPRPAHHRPAEAPKPASQSGARVITDKQHSRLWAIAFKAAQDLGIAELEVKDHVSAVIRDHGFDSTKDVTEDKYEAIISEIQEGSRP